ncbi:MAG TPA: hypothetical protein VGD50_03915, partial [Candidatus Baltobacteraceae bacterium]
GTALVGDPCIVAQRIREYQTLGIDTIIASGYPHLEEAHRVAELLFPLLGLPARRGHEVAASRALFSGGGHLSVEAFPLPVTTVD